MNALEAKRKSDSVIAENKRKADIAARKAAETRRKNAIEARKKFIADFNKEVDDHIAFAVKCGSKETRVYISGDVDSYVGASTAYEKHQHRSVIDRVMRRLRKDGYKAEFECHVTSHETQHESSVPDYTYYCYYATIKISWD